MAMFRNVMVYLGLGPDDEYDDGYFEDDESPNDRLDRETRRDTMAPAVVARRQGTATVEGKSRTRGDVPAALAGHPSDADFSGDQIGDRSYGVDGGFDDGFRDGVFVRPAETGEGQPVGQSRSFGGDAGIQDAGDRDGADLGGVGAVRPLRAVPDEPTFGDRDLPDLPADTSALDLDLPTAPPAPQAQDAEPQPQRRPAVQEISQPQRTKPVTVTPQSFGDAKHVADEFRAGVPVIMNLQGVDRDVARRLIDFASGICYCLDGSMEKAAPQVFLLTPSTAEVSDDDRRRMEDRGYHR